MRPEALICQLKALADLACDDRLSLDDLQTLGIAFQESYDRVLAAYVHKIGLVAPDSGDAA